MHFHGSISVSFGLKSSFFPLGLGKVPGGILQTEDEGYTINCFLLHYNMQLGPWTKIQNKMTFVVLNKIVLKGDEKDKGHIH